MKKVLIQHYKESQGNKKCLRPRILLEASLRFVTGSAGEEEREVRKKRRGAGSVKRRKKEGDAPVEMNHTQGKQGNTSPHFNHEVQRAPQRSSTQTVKSQGARGRVEEVEEEEGRTMGKGRQRGEGSRGNEG